MKKVTVVFSTSRKWRPFSALIKWWWGTQYSHICLRWKTPWGFSEILEAGGRDVHLREEALWNKKNKIIEEYEFNLTPLQFGRLMQELRPKLGTPYSWRQVVGIAIAELLGLKQNPLADRGAGFVCSEVGEIFCRIVRVPLQASRDRATPRDIRDAVKKYLTNKH